MLKDEMFRKTLPFLSGYDLLGTSGSEVDKEEYEALNKLERAIAKEIGEPVEDYGNHGPYG